MLRWSTALLTCALTVMLCAAAGAVVRVTNGGTIDTSLAVQAGLVTLGLCVLLRTSARAAGVVREPCLNCGAPTHVTLRSADRHPVQTCFACGFEDPQGAREPLKARVPDKPRMPEKTGPEY